jgi:hypothetical protein
MQKNGTGAAIAAYAPARVRVEGAERLVASLYRAGGASVLHLVNLADTVSETNAPVCHKDELVHFLPNAARLGELRVRIADAGDVKTVRLATPEREDEISLTVRSEGADTVIEIPENTFAAYAMLIME